CRARGAGSTADARLGAGPGPLEKAGAARLSAAALRGSATMEETPAFRRHMIFEMARMSTEDGLVMTLHPAVHRNHDPEHFARFGPDTGADIPISVEFTRALQPLLAAFGNHPNLNLVAFTIDETVYSRELAPMAGYYRSFYVG